MRLGKKCSDFPSLLAIRIDRVRPEDTECVSMISACNGFYFSGNVSRLGKHAAIMAFMIDVVRDWPKAELHVHLEGSIQPETLVVIDSGLSIEEARARYRFSDFAGFLESYKWANRKLSTPEHYGLVTMRLLEQLHTQGVVYAEINLSVGVVLWKEQDFEAIFRSIFAAAEASPVETRWVFDAIRHFGPEHVEQVASLALRYRDQGVVALGIGGDELRGPAAQFRAIFDAVRQQGLAALPHAGEIDGPASIWAALELGAARIGHGIRSIDDPLLTKHLRDHAIPLEICITSNVLTGAVPSLDAHPVRRLYDAGVPITLNTDDPAIFRTTLLDEYAIAARHFGFSMEELSGLAKNSLDFRLAQSAPAQLGV